AELTKLCDMGLFVRGEQEGDRVEVAHDRVREVVLGRLAEAERTRLHREIGARLLASHGDEDVTKSDGLFTVVNHLDAVMGKFDELSPERMLDLARLNYAAVKRALDSTAWIAARRYLDVAHQLIEPWLARAQAGEGEYALCVDVVFARAQASIAL